MMTLIRGALILTLPFALVILNGAAGAAQRRDVPMTPDRWESVVGTLEFKEHLGAPSVVVPAGMATLKDLEFTDGTIEFDIDPMKMGGGVGFRLKDREALEFLYFRPQPNCEVKPDCVQYAPVTRGVLLWDLYPEYQAPAPLRPGEWNHVKLVVSGRRLRLFVNGASTPSLDVGHLEGDSARGQLAVAGPAAFKNFSVTPDVVDGLPPGATADRTAGDARFVRQWQVAPPTPLADGAEPSIGDLPAASAAWRGLGAERGGLVNLSRTFGAPNPPPARSLTWLKTTISSTRPQSAKAAIGWSREIWVFVNGQRVFADKNLFQPPTARKPPDGRLSLQNGSFVLPLVAGDNEVAVALANNFYGWGLRLRLENLEGIRLARK